jgi:aconitate hydratase
MPPSPPSSDQSSFECLKHLKIGEKSYSYQSLLAAEENIGSLEKLPFCIRIFLENVLQHRKIQSTSLEDIQSLCTFHALKKRPPSLSFIPSHLILSENDAVSALTDMASLQNEIERQSPTPLGLTLGAKLDIVTDRSKFPLSASKERLRLLRWSQKRHEQIRLVPPEKGA